ncbi:DUF732 domain-containing protein [Actinomycetes bacterium M1A6_2h]
MPTAPARADAPVDASPIVETAAPGAATTAPNQPQTPEEVDKSFIELLTVSGYSLTPENSQSYIARARDTCNRLAGGADGQAVLNDTIASAQQQGLSERDGEGLFYFGVASYCQQFAPRLP